MSSPHRLFREDPLHISDYAILSYFQVIAILLPSYCHLISHTKYSQSFTYNPTINTLIIRVLYNKVALLYTTYIIMQLHKCIYRQVCAKISHTDYFKSAANSRSSSATAGLLMRIRLSSSFSFERRVMLPYQTRDLSITAKRSRYRLSFMTFIPDDSIR